MMNDDASLLARRLEVLKLLRGESYETISKAVGAHRSNLSAYVSSCGRSKNISRERVLSSLAYLGAAADGVLLPVLHFWMPTKFAIGDINSVLELATLNRLRCYHYIPLSGSKVYVLGVSGFGSRVILVLDVGFSEKDVDVLTTALGSKPGSQHEMLDAELHQLACEPTVELFDQVFYWLAQCVVDDVFQNNEAEPCS